MRILISLDGSPLAEKAIEPAVNLLHRAEGSHEMLLLRVVRYPSPDIGLLGAYNPFIMNGLLADALDASRDYLRQVSLLPAFHDMALTLIAKEGLPANVISEQAQQHQVDLIVLTSHGRSALTQVMLGSVAEAVARQAHIPTLIIRNTENRFPDHGRSEPLAVLVPLDGALLTESALDPAIALTRACGGAIRLLVMVPPQPGSAPSDRVWDDRSHHYLSLIQDRLEHQGIIAYPTLAWGDPATEIGAAIRHYHSDLVVMATQGHTGIVNLLEGSVADVVLHQVAIPVLVIHPSGDERDFLLPAATEDTVPPA